MKKYIDCKEQNIYWEQAQVGGDPLNPFSFRYLEMRVQGTPLKIAMPAFLSPKCNLDLGSYLPPFWSGYADIVNTNGCKGCLVS